MPGLGEGTGEDGTGLGEGTGAERTGLREGTGVGDGMGLGDGIRRGVGGRHGLEDGDRAGGRGQWTAWGHSKGIRGIYCHVGGVQLLLMKL